MFRTVEVGRPAVDFELSDTDGHPWRLAGLHAEWINRPSTFVIDQGGIVHLAYRGTFWGDRPSIEATLDMVVTGRYEYEHPKRLHMA